MLAGAGALAGASAGVGEGAAVAVAVAAGFWGVAGASSGSSGTQTSQTGFQLCFSDFLVATRSLHTMQSTWPCFAAAAASSAVAHSSHTASHLDAAHRRTAGFDLHLAHTGALADAVAGAGTATELPTHAQTHSRTHA